VPDTSALQDCPTYLLLGPPAVATPTGVVVVHGRRQNVLYALLALHAGTPVDTGYLFEAMWDDDLPAEPLGALQSQVSRLRSVLGCPIARGTDTYQLTATSSEVDIHRFDDLVRESRQLLDGGAAALARQVAECAVSLWRGSPFPSLTGVDFVAPETGRLDELRLEALVVRAQADLTLGRSAFAVISLRNLTAAYPLREDLWALLVRALYAGGRTGEALAAYRDARHTLVAELGLEPGPLLQGLEAAVLRHDPALARPSQNCSAHAQLLGATPRPPRRLLPEPALATFLDRVRATQPAYDPGPGECDDLLELVTLLDGDPLRIELAATQVPRRSLRQLVELHGRRAGKGRPGGSSLG